MNNNNINVSERPTLPAGRVIGGYEIIFLIGMGGFGDVYKVRDKKTSQMFALKTENIDAPKKSLEVEISCLNSISGECFPKLRSHGTDKKNKISYLVMNIMGASVGAIRRHHKNTLDHRAVYPIAIEMLRIIKIYHSFGYIHRDIKPSNFLIQQHPKDHLVLIDFGLCKKHIDPDTNKPYPFNTRVKFTGTRKYASINAHKCRELGRRDDLFSWYYSLVELFIGHLPWFATNDNEEILRMKKRAKMTELLNEFPSQIAEIYTYINSLKYQDRPDYKHIKQLLIDSMAEEKVNSSDFNWAAFYAAHSNLGDIRRSINLSMKSAGSSPRGMSNGLNKNIGSNGSSRFFNLGFKNTEKNNNAFKSATRFNIEQPFSPINSPRSNNLTSPRSVSSRLEGNKGKNNDEEEEYSYYEEEEEEEEEEEDDDDENNDKKIELMKEREKEKRRTKEESIKARKIDQISPGATAAVSSPKKPRPNIPIPSSPKTSGLSVNNSSKVRFDLENSPEKEENEENEKKEKKDNSEKDNESSSSDDEKEKEDKKETKKEKKNKESKKDKDKKKIRKRIDFDEYDYDSTESKKTDNEKPREVQPVEESRLNPENKLNNESDVVKKNSDVESESLTTSSSSEPESSAEPVSKSQSTPKEDNKKEKDFKVDSKSDLSKNDKSKSDKSKSDKSKSDESKSDESKSDKSKSDESKSDESKSDKSKSDKSKSDESKSDKSKSDESKNDKSKKDRLSSGNTNKKNNTGRSEEGNEGGCCTFQ